MSIDLGAKVLNGGNIPRASSGTSLPLNGIDNELFLLTTTNTIYYWKAGAWVATAGGGGGGNVSTAGLTVNQIPLANGATSITDSIIKQSGTLIQVAGNLSVLTNQFTFGRLRSIGTIPTIVAGAGLGVGGSALVVAGSTDCRGQFTITFDPVAVVPPNTGLATILFNTAYANSPKFVIIHCISSSGTYNTTIPTIHIPIASIGTTGFGIETGSVTTSLTNQTLTFTYLVVE